MKRITALVLCLVMVLSLAACSGSTGSTGNVGGFGNVADGDQEGKVNNNNNKTDEENEGGSAEVSAEVLEALGISAEEWAAMGAEKQAAILNELGILFEQQEKEEKEKETAKHYTPDDVMNGGSYRVVMGDYMNSITLYYENGKLVKIVEEFQKNSEELAEIYTYEGEDVAKYTFNFIDWANAPLQDILDGMKDYGGFGQYEIGKLE